MFVRTTRSANATKETLSGYAAHLAHTKRALHTEPATHGTTTQPLSSNADQQANLIGKRPQEEKPLDVSPCVHNISIDQENDNVGITDIKSETLATSIAAKIRIPYLLSATMTEARGAVSKCTGYIHGTQNRTIVPSLSLTNGKPVGHFFWSLVNTNLPIFQLR